MKLYGAHLSPFVNKVRLQIALKGLDAVEFCAPPGGDLKSSDYLALNPIGKVPTLEETVSRIDAVTVEDVRSFAARMAVSTPMALALYGPVEKAPGLAELERRRAA